jgi:poly(hydroxyalkanoate) depolymerase family esterase
VRVERRTRALIAGALAAIALAGSAVVVAADKKDPGEAAFQKGRLEDRLYRLYVPRALAATPSDALKVPLVVALHGCWQTPEDFALGTRLNEVAERRNLLVLYPAQSRRDNVSRCWNWFEAAQAPRSETNQLITLIRHVAQQHHAAERVIVLGFSAGGFMAVNLACVAPTLVRAVGVAAGGPYRCGVGLDAGLQCMLGQHTDGERSAMECRGAMGTGAHSIRASLWHGANDAVVNPVNLDALALMFARIAGVTAGAEDRREGAVYTLYRDTAGRASLETWLIPGMGHAWSGGDIRATHTYPPGPSATERMLDFLLE